MSPSTVTTTLLAHLVGTAEQDGIERTAVGAVIPAEGGRVLLLRRPAGDYLGGLWELPSGGVDEGETLTDALRREATEETGLTIETIGAYLGHFDYHSGSGRATRQFNFTATLTSPTGTVRLTEHDAHLWADEHQQTLTSNAVQAVLAAWRHHQAS
ncbi:NUDIX hydrolase [Streptomyces sp. NPDC013953]|uniref:NUDIX hydrolase n=1 Tax=Streptomyces sp. NPDC013953 TaxID=3364868 RepID=UPI0037025AF6